MGVGSKRTAALQELTFCRHQPQALQNAKYYTSPWGSRAVSEGKFSTWGNAFVCCRVTCNDAAQDNHTMPRLVLPKPPWLVPAVSVLCSLPSCLPGTRRGPLPHSPNPRCPGYLLMPMTRGREVSWQERGAGPRAPTLGGGSCPRPMPAAPPVPLLWLTASQRRWQICPALLSKGPSPAAQQLQGGVISQRINV